MVQGSEVSATHRIQGIRAPLSHWALWELAHSPAIDRGPLVPTKSPTNNRYLF